MCGPEKAVQSLATLIVSDLFCFVPDPLSRYTCDSGSRMLKLHMTDGEEEQRPASHTTCIHPCMLCIDMLLVLSFRS